MVDYFYCVFLCGYYLCGGKVDFGGFVDDNDFVICKFVYVLVSRFVWMFVVILL